ncbi:MAG: energy transducer TonB [Nitrospirota bacterium]|nr:MAG: energy transducer TonB [Nitrospirota bacterium]
MTAAEPFVFDPPQPSVTIYAILSIVLHAGLLAGLGFLPRSTPTTEAVPVVQISLVPSQSEIPSVSPPQPPPSFRSASRSVKPALPSSPPSSRLMTSQLKSVTSTLKSPPTHETQDPLIDSPKKRVLKDQPAADALVARTLVKMIKPQSTQSETLTPPQPSEPKLSTKSNQAPQTTLVDPSAIERQTQTSSTLPTQRRVLMALPPGGQTVPRSKVGIVRFVKPLYPSVAKDAGWEGTVIVRVLVQTNGLPGEVTIKKSSGHSILDKAAKEAVHQWRFKPEKDGNIPIKKYVDIPLKFELHKNEKRG